MSQEIEKLAYLLWEQAGRPYCDDDRFWQQAKEQLEVEEDATNLLNCLTFAPIPGDPAIDNPDKTWKLSSGVLEVEGAGNVDEMVDIFLRHAHDKNQQLDETVVATCGPERVEYRTISNLKRLGLWN